MFFKDIRFICLFAFCVFGIKLSAQKDYRAEVGFSGGGAYYLGDANNTLFRNTNFTYSGFFRYRVNPRIAFKADLNRSKVVWDKSVAGNDVNSLDATGEFNFFDLENNSNKRLSKVFTPYIFGGIGLMNYLYQNNQTFRMGIPVGIGMKFIVSNRLNLNLQWTNRLVLADDLEDAATLNNVANINGSNFTNNDLLSTLTLGISIDIWKKQCDCKDTNKTR